MLLFRKKYGFKRKKNNLRRFYDRYSGLLPFVAIFSLGVFGTSVYYKNQPAVAVNQKYSHSNKIEALTAQLNNEKDITDSLSSKNLELKKALKEALSKVSNNDKVSNNTDLISDLEREKQSNQILRDENSRLQARLNYMLTKLEATKNRTKNIAEVEVKPEAKGSRNGVQDSNIVENTKDKNFTKVKMDLDEENTHKAESLTNRNRNQKVIKTEEVTKKSVKNDEKRTMKLKKGESLWDLSKRAYGKGIYYKKIIEANPSITEKGFKKLRPGAVIYVPLSE